MKYVHRMQQDLFDVLEQAPSREELQMIKSKAVWFARSTCVILSAQMYGNLQFIA
jgi:hypothetical protein